MCCYKNYVREKFVSSFPLPPEGVIGVLLWATHPQSIRRVEVWCKALLNYFALFDFCDSKLKLCQFSLQKWGRFLIFRKWKVFQNEMKKSNHVTKEPFSIIFTKKNYKKFKLKKKMSMIYIGYWLVNFLDHTNMPSSH